MVTRRCTQRQYLLLPSHVCKEVFLYALALAQRETGVQVHVVVVLSNHYHLMLSLFNCLLPDFAYVLDKYIAKCMNAYYGRWENFFAAGVQPSYVRCEDEESMLKQAVYSITNPVKDGLVKRSADWPGLLLWRPGRYRAKRPTVFFAQTDNQDGPCPPELTLELSPLPLSSFENQRAVMERLGRDVHDKEKAVRKQFRQQGRTFLGVARILAQHHTDSPSSYEPRRKMSPKVAAFDKWRRIERLQQNKRFVQEHTDCRLRFSAGQFDVVFPVGTYLMQRRFNVRCAEP